MKINAIETVRIPPFENLLWIRIETDEGVTGLGESSKAPQTVETYIHEWCAPRLIGTDPLRIPERRASLEAYLGWGAAGVETRAASAVDIALWDIVGKAQGRPVADALGGRARDEIRTYNTCAGSGYMRKAIGQRSSNYALDMTGDYEDLDAFLNRADELAHSLLEEGVTGMKIWPFDTAAERTGGRDISPEELARALEPFEKIRGAVGDRMDIMVEFHSLWSLPMAKRLARILAEYDTYWHEDPFRLDNPADVADYAAHCESWVCVSETLSSIHHFREMLATGAVGVAMFDLGWCGGFTDAKKIATLAEAWKVPCAPHDCTGPVGYAAGSQLAMHIPNALIMESVRAFYKGWYNDLVTGLPIVKNGMLSIPEAPGHGVELLPDVLKRDGVMVRRST
ncbi:mandelate racemase/muconate lactonizing enzyme family protein [Acuticoccus mangrovi]|uniref:Mandelate racemase/muconate lactonizing enzyme family protein n=1 Tax=Acuticoccus mangrovi TaxID=2796142 RepID=A0A934MH84_9HYPH|nr:mandelate racemase/muconate lactonizing enzyme family protein [Acuticoccus mangrovi]MBJ3777388.1 mandelate racemase/muconate lactonizing enzyme family protein [Acuticoccus mangrovi]